ncbi:hypothetical protein C0Q70_15963 [Pomacea canaliculata]|uniref:Cadherin domain-containing protein n=1 Tax=Pomacea canaliculata TaxID=400727 RepID=A0A2T7NNE9_POMCA|nr:hypothetical protein C0Q70_15963 [Pomacea canaliculata]
MFNEIHVAVHVPCDKLALWCFLVCCRQVAYIPPTADIGPESRLVRFAYTIEDSSANKLYGQTFDIEILPVNNQVPAFVTNKLLVEEGGHPEHHTQPAVGHGRGHAVQRTALHAGRPASLWHAPEGGQEHEEGGHLHSGGSSQKTHQNISLSLSPLHCGVRWCVTFRYIHDGSDVVLDTFTLALTDGLNQETKVISVEIVPIDDQTPQLSQDLRPLLIVSEGDEAAITPRILSATDEDTDDEALIFLIVKQPRYGVLQLKDQNFLASSDLPVYDLNITITPVNNQKPVIQLGNPILVAEGESFRFSEDVLSVTDADSKTKTVVFMITKQPQWGFIENIKPSPGSEKSNAGKRVNSFNFGDILDGSVNYVQANHRGVLSL